MGASYEEMMNIPIAAEVVWQRAIQALNSLPEVSGLMTHPGMLNASVNLNWRSWGETLTVLVDQVPDGTLVRIRSECVFPLQVFDWGKNRDNVKKVRAGLEPPARTNFCRQ